MYIKDRKGLCISDKILNCELKDDNLVFQRTEDTAVLINSETTNMHLKSRESMDEKYNLQDSYDIQLTIKKNEEDRIEE